MDRDTEIGLMILVGLYVLSKYSFEIVPALERQGASLYDVVHDDKNHMTDLPANEVPEELTPLPPVSARQYLDAALGHALDRVPTKTESAMIAAHSDFETAGWRKMHNFNFGNLEVTPGHPWYRLKNNPQRFRSYVSPSEGAAGMVFLIKSHYPRAFALLGSGDPAGYAKALRDRGYYTASLATYAAGLQARLRSYA
jgi:hypothetical protein